MSTAETDGRKPATPGESPAPQDSAPIEELLGVVAEGIHFQIDQLDILDQHSRVGKYHVSNVLGYGGQACCFRAEDEELRRQVVLKVYRQDLSDDLKRLILQEGRALAGITSAHVAQCHTAEQINGYPFLVLEYVDGQSLARWRSQHTPDSATALKIAEQIADALAAVHDKDLLHLDLKPDNVVIDQNGDVKLIDFGLSRRSDDLDEAELAGSPAFLAPERAISGEASAVPTDIYGLGGVLYFLLTGGTPVKGSSREEILNKVAEGNTDLDTLLKSGSSRHAIQFCQKCLQFLPAERFQTAGEAKACLLAQRNARTRRRNIAVATFATVLLAATAWFVNSWSGSEPVEVVVEVVRPAPAQLIRESLANRNFERAIEIEKEAFKTADANQRFLSHRRMARYAEQGAMFKLAAEYHTRALTHLMSNEFENEFDIVMRRQLIESCERISEYSPPVQAEVARGLEHIYAAGKLPIADPRAASSSLRAGLTLLRFSLPGDDFRIGLALPDYVLMRDSYDHRSWPVSTDSIIVLDELDLAEEILARELGDQHPATLQINYVRGLYFAQEARWEDTERCFKHFYENMKKVSRGRISDELATAEIWMGAYFTFSRIEKPLGKQLIEKALEKRIALFGEKSVEAVEFLNFLINASERDEAMRLSEQSVTISEALLAEFDIDDLESHPRAAIESRLAESLLRQGEVYLGELYSTPVSDDSPVTEENLRKALVCYRRARQLFGNSNFYSMQYVTLMRNTAKIHIQQGSQEQATRCVNIVVSIYNDLCGEDGIHMVGFQWILGDIALASGERDRAIKIYRKLIIKARSLRMPPGQIEDFQAKLDAVIAANVESEDDEAADSG